MASNHTKTSFSSANLHKNAGKMSFVRNKIEFCNKIRVSAFLVKIEFPLKRTKNKPGFTCRKLITVTSVDRNKSRANDFSAAVTELYVQVVSQVWPLTQFFPFAVCKKNLWFALQANQ